MTIKFKIILSIIFTTIIILIISLIITNNKKDISLHFYTIKENKSYVYKLDRRMNFDIYSNNDNNLLNYSNDINIRLYFDEYTSYKLENIDIKKDDMKDYFIYKISCDIPYVYDEISSLDAYLEINTSRYHFNAYIGSLSIINPSYDLLSVSAFSATYSNINGINELVGINIEFTNEYHKIKEFKIGSYIKGDLENILYENYNHEIDIYEIIPDYEIEKNIFNNEYNLLNNNLFIPLSYEKLYTTRQGYILINLDGINYYFDTFDFIITNLNFNYYKNKNRILECEIIYA